MTLNQVITEIRTIGEKHEQIKFVYLGDPWNRLSDGEITYPALFYNLQDNYSYTKKEVEYKFSIVLLDRQLSENSNEFEVLSDMDLIAQDVITQLRSPRQKWIIGDIISVVPFVESEPDYLAGVRFDISLTLPFWNDGCNPPSSYDK